MALSLASLAVFAIFFVSLYALEIPSHYKQIDSLFPSYLEYAHDKHSILVKQPDEISPSKRLTRMIERKIKGLGDSGNGSFQFIPELKASLFSGQSATWSGNCYSNYTAKFLLDSSASTFDLSLDAEDRTEFLCTDIFLVADWEGFYVKFILDAGVHQLTVTDLSAAEIEQVTENGVAVFLIQGEIVGTVIDIWDTLLLFEGPWTEETSLEFLQDHMNITYQPRSNGFINIPKSQLHSGDYLATQRFDGSEVMIQYGTGSYSGHSVVVIEMNGTFFVCESTGENSPDYWPPPYGVICHDYDEWMALANQAEYCVTWMPLAPDLRAKWNNTAAVNFVNSVLGMPYGYHNFIFGWIDTPSANFPPPFSSQFMATGFQLFDVLQPNLSQSIWNDALNKRLNTNCNTTICLYDIMTARNLSFNDVMDMPEQDSWFYSDGKSMVCDVFVLEIYKAAGVFDVEFQATEFTPKDLYTLNIFDDTDKSSICPGDEIGLPLCQIMGNTVMRFPGWNTIVPYDNMCNNCQSAWPNYERLPANC